MNKEWRRMMFQLEDQDECYRVGAYNYQEEIGLYPKYEIIAGYIRWFGCHRIIDVGCGQAKLVDCLYHDEDCICLDQSPTAIEMAKTRTNNAHCVNIKTDDYVNNLRHWADCIVWAGVGMPWTEKGYGGDYNDMGEVFPKLDIMLRDKGYIIMESAGHIHHLERMLVEMYPQYQYVTGCNIETLDCEVGPRSIRMYQRRHIYEKCKT